VQSFLPRGHKVTKIHEVQHNQLEALRDSSGHRDFVVDIKLSKLLLINYYLTAS